MRYYVAADTHSFFAELQAALEAQGFFRDREPHKLILCGDLFDRGPSAQALQDFVLELMERDGVILIRGNHEDLALELLNAWRRKSYLHPQHYSNGTIGTVCQLTGATLEDFYCNPEEIRRKLLETPYLQTIIPAMLDYYETEHYIFTHGWIPCTQVQADGAATGYEPVPDWRHADRDAWNRARWINGMEAAHAGVTEPGKTIVCGHWHCSFGHARYEGRGGEFRNTPDFTPYYGAGVIGLDGCAAVSGRVNCIVLED